MWLTNDPVMAQKLHAIDAEYLTARNAAKALPLAAKVEALRVAKRKHEQAMREAAESITRGGV